MRKTRRATYTILALTLASIAAALFVSVWRASLAEYRETDRYAGSEIAPLLRIFAVNQSQHPDPVKRCWYDSGDYLVYLPRNLEALQYLSLAYREAARPAVKEDLRRVIDQQLGCVTRMLGDGYKQFRDQKNHGLNLPPAFNALFYPNNVYAFRPDEGRDVYARLAVIYTNLGRDTEAGAAFEAAKQKTSATVSEQCCEDGPLSVPADELSALYAFDGLATSTPDGLWGIGDRSQYALKTGVLDEIAAVLAEVRRKFASNGSPFNYLGGNYDIAGTIALERLYAKASSDLSFRDLSDRLYAYLHGQNDFQTDFTAFPKPYHPCGFWNACQLTETLINGVDETGRFNTSRREVWRHTEIQLVGQAKYVLAYVLYHDL